MEVLNDYVLMVMFNGISSPEDVTRVFSSMLNGLRGSEDLCSEPSFLTMQREEGVKRARHLLQVLDEIDNFATDSLGVADAWPRWVNTRWEYSGTHERFKPLRELARVWKIDLEVALHRGRPRGSTKIALLEFPLLYRQAYKEEKNVADAEARPVSQLDVAQRLGLEDSKTLRSYLKKTGEDWPPPIN